MKLFEYQRAQVISATSSGSDDKNSMFCELSRREKSKFKDSLKSMLQKYEGKEIDEKTQGLLQGIKTSHFDAIRSTKAIKSEAIENNLLSSPCNKETPSKVVTFKEYRRPQEGSSKNTNRIMPQAVIE